jgi:hypothetical protein
LKKPITKKGLVEWLKVALSSNPNTEKKKKGKKIYDSWALVAHTCNPSYSGGRDQEDCGLMPAPANSFREPILKIHNTKQGW